MYVIMYQYTHNTSLYNIPPIVPPSSFPSLLPVQVSCTIRIRMRAHAHVRIRAYAYTHIHTHTHTGMQTCRHAGMQAYTYTYTYTYTRYTSDLPPCSANQREGVKFARWRTKGGGGVREYPRSASVRSRAFLGANGGRGGF